MMAARAEALLRQEVAKGCSPDIMTGPVALEPRYLPFTEAPELLSGQVHDNPVPEALFKPGELVRTQIWLSPEEEFSWLHSELFLKQLGSASHRIGFEILGNVQGIRLQFLVHHRDLPILETAFRGHFERCELSAPSAVHSAGITGERGDEITFLDCYPPPPYSHLLTRPDELKITTYQSLVVALMGIEPPATGFYQALFQPVNARHCWHRNVRVLLDIEYNLKLISGVQLPQRYLQQAPSGDLHHMARELETKAHNDKPLYALALRIGVASPGKDGSDHVKVLATFLNLFQHGGRPLKYVTDKDYSAVLSRDTITEMFTIGATYRPGFLVNSAELTGPVHIPPAEILEYHNPPLPVLETLPVRNANLHSGTPIGTCVYAGIEQPVCIPLDVRSRSTHIIGKPGTTKSTTMARMVLDDIDKGIGVAVLDPHGDLVEALLCLIKEKHVERTIYFDPGDPNHVPIWNPLKKSAGQDLSRTADDLVAAIKSVVTGWGDRMEHLLRHGLYALLQLSDSTLLDLSNLLRRKTDESERLRKEILDVVDNQTAYLFWKNDFNRYSNEALDPPKHKLSKLLVAGTVSLMLSQPESLIDFRQAMDEGKVLLVNLARIGSEVREILGCFMLSQFHLMALGRSDTSAANRRQFHIYADEAHRFITEALEDLIAETRKFGVSLTLAHHYLRQFAARQIDALSSTAATIIMNVDSNDARHLTKDLQNLVHRDDLITLEVGEAIARIGTDIIRFKTHGPLQIPERNFKAAIIKRSQDLYYKPVHAVQSAIRQQDNRWNRTFSPLTAAKTGDVEEFFYDEF